MFIEERHKAILDLLNQSGKVKVNELSKIFKVSEDTIRRDLRILSDAGLAKKTYGGAIKAGTLLKPSQLEERLSENIEQKRLIMKYSEPYIKEGDTILLDGSSTTEYLLPLFSKFTVLSIVTNSLSLAINITRANPKITVNMPGGTVDPITFNCVGVETYKSLESLFVDKVFLSPCSMDADGILYSTSKEEAYVKQVMSRIGEQIFILIDSSKIGKKSYARIRKCDPGDIVITENGILDHFNCK